MPPRAKQEAKPAAVPPPGQEWRVGQAPHQAGRQASTVDCGGVSGAGVSASVALLFLVVIIEISKHDAPTFKRKFRAVGMRPGEFLACF